MFAFNFTIKESHFGFCLSPQSGLSQSSCLSFGAGLRIVSGPLILIRPTGATAGSGLHRYAPALKDDQTARLIVHSLHLPQSVFLKGSLTSVKESLLTFKGTLLELLTERQVRGNFGLSWLYEVTPGARGISNPQDCSADQ